MNILSDILSHKKREVERAKMERPLSSLERDLAGCPAPRDFLGALQGGRPTIIAEIKKNSPSRGTLVSVFDHRRIAAEYQQGGAGALSVLTDRKFFGGDPAFISDVRSVSSLPVLRKDFIIDEYQVIESRMLGSDAILLIVKILDESRLRELLAAAGSVGLPAIVEVHTRSELDIALKSGATVIGVNNRNLEDFSVSLKRSMELRRLIGHGVLTVSESGIRTIRDVESLRDAGFHAILVGESLMRAPNRINALRELSGK